MSLSRASLSTPFLIFALAGCSDRDGVELGRSATPDPTVQDPRPGGVEPTHRAILPGSAADETLAVYVVLAREPAVSAFDGSLPLPQRVAATRDRLRAIEADQSALRSALEARGVVVISELKRLANALLVLARRDLLDEIRALPGVVRIDPAPRVTS